MAVMSEAQENNPKINKHSQHCWHEHLRYCAECRVVYCSDCGHEWWDWDTPIENGNNDTLSRLAIDTKNWLDKLNSEIESNTLDAKITWMKPYSVSSKKAKR
jgi:hypothetical protein